MVIRRPGIPVLGYFRLFFVVAGSLYFNQVVFGGVNFIVEKKKTLCYNQKSNYGRYNCFFDASC